MQINIFGASGSGSTTLGKALGARLNYPVFDGDQYFWMSSEIPFTVKLNPEERNAMINRDIAAHDNWIVSGSVVGWKNNWEFDLSIFLYIPHDIRMSRLKKREFERYGDKIHTDPERIVLYHNFLDWANGYDDNTTDGRTLQVHQTWMENLTKPLLMIEGDTTVEERVEAVVRKLSDLKQI
ncbi:AAA family ATPase [Mucilaginibacter flavus]|uniref:AAA family ATPase n=1 Tax=Mucilaginibacter flavus TaxID=931504 RepID=UPI0025B2E7C3|nr:AAA family ATPase [Mucilaginibacter flavus]MDN3583922.1 AAA family ATPase [Mucilaginibacter flavus]